jgi:hypothetical protein
LLATEGGIALTSPAGVCPQDRWLHQLFLDLRAIDSNHVRMFSDYGGIVERLCAASATYCLRLHRRSLDYWFISNRPQNLRSRLDDYTPTDADKDKFGNHIVYKPLAGSWYLYISVSH